MKLPISLYPIKILVRAVLLLPTAGSSSFEVRGAWVCWIPCRLFVAAKTDVYGFEVQGIHIYRGTSLPVILSNSNSFLVLLPPITGHSSLESFVEFHAAFPPEICRESMQLYVYVGQRKGCIVEFHAAFSHQTTPISVAPVHLAFPFLWCHSGPEICRESMQLYNMQGDVGQRWKTTMEN